MYIKYKNVYLFKYMTYLFNLMVLQYKTKIYENRQLF